MVKIVPHESLYEAILRASKEAKTNVALYYFNEKIRWDRFIYRVNQFANGLKKDGVKPGDVVTLLLPNIPEAIYLMYAVSQVGAILNPLHPLLPKIEVMRTISETHSKHLYCLQIRYDEFKDEDLTIYDFSPAHELPKWKQIFAKQEKCHHECPYYKEEPLQEFVHMDLEDALYLNSGGTSGLPKIVRLSSFSVNSLCANAPWLVGEVKDNSGILCVMPIFHGFGLAVGIHLSLSLGYHAALMPKFNRKMATKMLKRKQYSLLLGIPIFYEKMLRYPGFAGKKLRQLDHAFVGGDFALPSLNEKFNKRMEEGGSKCRLYEGYGLTETVSLFSVNTKFESKDGTVGKALKNVSFKVLDENLKEVPVGQNGELYCTGDTLMNGYLNAKDPFVSINGVKYVSTGDNVYQDEEGFIHFNQRIKRIVKISGIPVFPHEIEYCVSTLDIVYEAAAIGVEDERFGSLLKLYIVLNKHYNGTEEEAEKLIREEIKKTVSIYANPKEIVFIKSLPHTEVGKVDLKQLK